MWLTPSCKEYAMAAWFGGNPVTMRGYLAVYLARWCLVCLSVFYGQTFVSTHATMFRYFFFFIDSVWLGFTLEWWACLPSPVEHGADSRIGSIFVVATPCVGVWAAWVAVCWFNIAVAKSTQIASWSCWLIYLWLCQEVSEKCFSHHTWFVVEPVCINWSLLFGSAV